MDIDFDIDMALSVPISDTFCEYSPIFSNTCENLEEKNRIISFKNKDVLVPASSGDQYLFCKYIGSKSVTTYDINRLTKYYMNLKIAAIKTFNTLPDFHNFLITNSNNLFSTKVDLIYRIFDNLDSEDLYFWKNYLEKAKNLNKLVTNKEARFDLEYIKRGMPFYSDNIEYIKLRKKLISSKKPKFINNDLFNITTVVKDKFDLIDLSNIISTDIIHNFYTCVYDDLEKNWENVLFNEIITLLKKNGYIFVDYIYNINHQNKPDYLKNKKFKEFKIQSKSNTQDLVYVLKK